MTKLDACRRGHPFTEDNTRWRRNTRGPYRECRECVRLRERQAWKTGQRPVGGPQAPLTATEALVLDYLAYRRDGGAAKATIDGWRSALLRFAETVGDKPPAEITKADVQGWVNRPGLKATTRRQARSYVTGFFMWATSEGHIPTDPTLKLPRVRVPRALPRALTPQQVEGLLAALPDPRARLVVVLMYDLGLRACEVSRLTIEDIGTADQTITVTGKGGHQRRLPVPARAWAMLATETAGRTTGPVIRCAIPPGVKGKPSPVNDTLPRVAHAYEDRPITPNHLSRLVSRWMADAGIDATGHALRHSFAGDLVRGGADLAAVQQLLGHSNLAVTSRYAVFEDPARLREAMARRHGMDQGKNLGKNLGKELGTIPDTPTTDPAMLSALVDVVADLAEQVAQLRSELERTRR